MWSFSPVLDSKVAAWLLLILHMPLHQGEGGKECIAEFPLLRGKYSFHLCDTADGVGK
jgi:hypothetical protein